MRESVGEMQHCVEDLKKCFSGKHRGFSKREPQRRYIFEYLKAFFSTEDSVLIEAGTGVGKTLGYLLPTIVIAKRLNKRVLVSTATKNLQEQVAKKDIPMLESLLGESVSYEVIKGSGNYLCLSKLSKLLENADKRTADVLGGLRDLFTETDWNGDLSDVAVGVEGFNLGVNGCDDNCDEREVSCPHKLLKERVRSTDLIIANHSLVSTNEWLISDNTLLVFDEAHRLLDVLVSKSIEEFSFPSLRLLLRSLDEEFNEPVNIALERMDELEVLVVSELLSEAEGCVYLSNDLCEAILNLADSLKFVEVAFGRREEGFAQEIQAVVTASDTFYRAVEIFSDYRLAAWFSNDRGAIHLFSADFSQLESSFCSLVSSAQFTLLTSATLSGIGRSLYGVDRHFTQLKVESPFDYANRASIYVDENSPNPSFNDRFVEYICEYLYAKYLVNSRASLVLFSSRKMMQEVFERTKKLSMGDDVEIFVQGHVDRETLLCEHKKVIEQGGRSIIFGLASFSEGVDLPREYLTRVVVTKMTFPSPTEPANKAYTEFIESSGGDGFRDYALPMATRSLVQSVGRLVRTELDYGDVIVMDNRLMTTKYGREMLRHLPPLKVKQAD